MAPIPSGFPSSATTGVPSGTALSVYTGPMTITEDGTVIDGMIINGSLTILANNVTIKNSVINFNGYYGINASRASNLTVTDSDIVGPGYGGNVVSGILGSGTFLRNDISKVENGIQLTSGSSVVVGNYIHDLQSGQSSPHYDGISVQGQQNNVLIQGNTIESRDTSAIFIKNDFGSISNVTVTGNYLFGDAGYQIYVDGRGPSGTITNVSITGNYIEAGGYGHLAIMKSSPVVQNNTLLAEGQVPGAIVAPTTPTAPTVPTSPTTPTTPTAPTDNSSGTPSTETGGYPSEDTAGVPDGKGLSVYSGPMRITTDGTVIDGMIINGTLTIAAKNVTIKNSVIEFTGLTGIDGRSASNLTIENTEISGSGSSSAVAIRGSGKFLNNDISDVGIGIQLGDGSSTIKGNYIHDVVRNGISANGKQSGVIIEGNTIESAGTSAIFIKNDFGRIDNITVTGNLVTGSAGYQLYVDGRGSGGAITNVSVTDNIVEQGSYGYVSINKASPTVSGNTLLAKGEALSFASDALSVRSATHIADTVVDSPAASFQFNTLASTTTTLSHVSDAVTPSASTTATDKIATYARSVSQGGDAQIYGLDDFSSAHSAQKKAVVYDHFQIL